MRKPVLPAILVFFALACAPALAGPPLICHSIAIGTAASLPWQGGEGWNGMDPSYDSAHLVRDTLALLGPQVPVNVRMETLRRAAIYSSRQPELAGRLTTALMARALDDAAQGTAPPTAFFDAGYFVETVHEAARMASLLHANRAAWLVRDGAPDIDGTAWIDTAIRIGGRDMQQAQAIVLAARKTFR